VLQSKHAFATHNALLHSDRRKYYECHYCGRKFRTLGTIRTHVVEHATNPNELLTVACDFCEKKFVDEKSLRLHHRAHVCKYFYVSIDESMSIFCVFLFQIHYKTTVFNAKNVRKLFPIPYIYDVTSKECTTNFITSAATAKVVLDRSSP
jgi:hypothetical protein